MADAFVLHVNTADFQSGFNTTSCVTTACEMNKEIPDCKKEGYCSYIKVTVSKI